jgi:hypothetical protein
VAARSVGHLDVGDPVEPTGEDVLRTFTHDD